jgi:lipopolysaccharide export system protein LptA
MKAYSQGDVTAVDNKGNRVRADEMTAYFTKNAQGKMILDKIDIAGNVKITSPNGDISAHSGTYYATINVIKLFDDIIITQNGNILKGSRAETDLNSGISRILAGDKARVSGVFKETKKPHK